MLFGWQVNSCCRQTGIIVLNCVWSSEQHVHLCRAMSGKTVLGLLNAAVIQTHIICMLWQAAGCVTLRSKVSKVNVTSTVPKARLFCNII